MGLNVKLSLVVCIGFIVGMVWLVNEVGRPARSTPTIAASRVGQPLTERMLVGEKATGKFQRESAAAEKVAPVTPAHTPELPSPAPALATATSVKLPPLHWPEPPEVIEDQQATEVAIAPVATTPPAIAAAEVDDEVNENNRTLNEAGNAEMGRTRHAAWPPAVAGSGALMMRPQADQAPRRPRKYEVKKGDTLAKVAQQTLKSDDSKAVAAIVAANPSLKARHSKLLAGETLVIPGAPTAPPKNAHATAAKEITPPRLVAGADGKGPGKTPRAPEVAADKKSSAKGVAKSSTGTPRTPAARTYVVRANDSLATIARRMLGDERRWRELQQLNKLPADGRLQAGAKLKIPAERNT